MASGLRPRRPRARPPVSRYALAVDIGGTKMEAALVREDGTLVDGSRSRQATGREATFQSLDFAVAAVIAHAHAPLPAEAELVGAGVGSAGPIDRTAGAIFPVNMPLARGYALAASVHTAASAIRGWAWPRSSWCRWRAATTSPSSRS